MVGRQNWKLGMFATTLAVVLSLCVFGLVGWITAGPLGDPDADGPADRSHVRKDLPRHERHFGDVYLAVSTQSPGNPIQDPGLFEQLGWLPQPLRSLAEPPEEASGREGWVPRDSLLGGQYHLVLNNGFEQFENIGEAEAAWKTQIENAGATVLFGIPLNAWVVRATGEQLDAIAGLADTEFVTQMQPGWKVLLDTREFLRLNARALSGSATAEEMERRSHYLDTEGNLRLEVNFFKGETVRQYQGELRRLIRLLGPRAAREERLRIQIQDIVNEQNERVDLAGSLVVTIESEQLGDLAELIQRLAYFGAVETIAIQRPQYPLLRWAATGVQTGIQTGTGPFSQSYDSAAKVWRNGVLGVGQGTYVVDAEYGNDMCYFRYCAQDSCATAPNTTQPPTSNTTNPANKVISFHLMTGATTQSASDHGTQTAGCMVADDFSFLARDDDTSVDQSTPSDGTVIDFHQGVTAGMAPGAYVVLVDATSTGGINASSLTNHMLQAYDDTSVQSNTANGVYPAILRCAEIGPRISNHSYGSGVDPNGETPAYGGASRNADTAHWRLRDFQAFFSAGNTGPAMHTIEPNSNHQALNVMTLGAAVSGGAGDPYNVASYSAHGPGVGLFQGVHRQIKPNVVVPGNNNMPIESDGREGYNPPGETGSPGDCGNASASGTSFSGPAAAGASALVYDYFNRGYYPSGAPTVGNEWWPSNHLIRAVMINSCRDFLHFGGGAYSADDGTAGATGNRPNGGQGWGYVTLDDSLFFQGDAYNQTPNPNEGSNFGVLTDTYNTNGTYQINYGDNPQAAFSTFDPAGGTFHQFQVKVSTNPVAEPLRFTAAWSPPGNTALSSLPLVNDLDLEVRDPGADGVNGNGDDRFWRGSTISNWSGGWTILAPDGTWANPDSALTGSQRDDNYDRVNNVENVFIPPADVRDGIYVIRVYARSSKAGTEGPGTVTNAEPDTHPNVNDGVNGCSQATNVVSDGQQGYSLVLTGNFARTLGQLAWNRSQYGCGSTNNRYVLTLREGNMVTDDPRCTGGPPNCVEVVVASQGGDSETIYLGKSGTLKAGQCVAFSCTDPNDPIFSTSSHPVQMVNNPSDIIIGDGILQGFNKDQLTATYTDLSDDPTGNTKVVAFSVLDCAALSADGGFDIQGGCDWLDTTDHSKGTRPDNFMDTGELVAYTAFFWNTTPDDLTDVRVTLTSLDTTKASVLDSPKTVGAVDAGSQSSATFQVLMTDTVVDNDPLTFEVGVSAPGDGLVVPAKIFHAHSLEVDLESRLYSTQDPNGTWNYNQDSLGLPIIMSDMTVGGKNPSLNNDPWDFDDDNDGWTHGAFNNSLFAYKGASNWAWSNAGGCGWENQIEAVTTKSGGKGIWHNGAIGSGTDQGHKSKSAAPNCTSYTQGTAKTHYHFTLWHGQSGKSPTRPIQKVNGPDFTVRFKLLIHYGHVWGHDTSTSNFSNFMSAWWYTDNGGPNDPAATPPTWDGYEYGIGIDTQVNMPTDWSRNTNFLDANIERPGVPWGDQRPYEDIYGAAGTAFNVAFAALYLEESAPGNGTEYGWGIDNVDFRWAEERLVGDQTDCVLGVQHQCPRVGAGCADDVDTQQALVFFDKYIYESCGDPMTITVVDSTIYGTGANNDALVENVEVELETPEFRLFLLATETAADSNVFIASTDFSTLSENARGDVQDVPKVGDGSVKVGLTPPDAGLVSEVATATYRDLSIYTALEAVLGDNDGRIGKDEDNDGSDSMSADDEDRLVNNPNNCSGPTCGEPAAVVQDVAGIFCPTSTLFYLRNQLVETAQCGDNDGILDPYETVDLSIWLLNGLSVQVENLTVQLLCDHPGITIKKDTAFFGTVASDAIIDNTADPFQVACAPSVSTTDVTDPERATFFMNLFSDTFKVTGVGVSAYRPESFELKLDLDPPASNAPSQVTESFETTSSPRCFTVSGACFVELDADPSPQGGGPADASTGAPIFPPSGLCNKRTMGEGECELPFRFDGNQVDDWHQHTHAGGADAAADGTRSAHLGLDGTQKYSRGQYAAIEFPPICMASDGNIQTKPGMGDANTYQLSFDTIVDTWLVNWTNGERDLFDGAVVEVGTTTNTQITNERLKFQNGSKKNVDRSWVTCIPATVGSLSMTSLDQQTVYTLNVDFCLDLDGDGVWDGAGCPLTGNQAANNDYLFSDPASGCNPDTTSLTDLNAPCVPGDVPGTVHRVPSTLGGSIGDGAEVFVSYDCTNRVFWRLNPNSPDSAYHEFSVRPRSNLCRTLFCDFRHPAWAKIGFYDASNGHTWENVTVDLSDFEAQTVVLRLVFEMQSDLTPGPGDVGWYVDNVIIDGVDSSCTNPMVIDPNSGPTEGGSGNCPDPTALECDFTVNQSVACAGSTFKFFEAVAGGTPPYSFTWDFGDGTTLSPNDPLCDDGIFSCNNPDDDGVPPNDCPNGVANPLHCFAAPGTYVVRLSATDSSVPPQQCAIDFPITVTAGPTASIASFTPNPAQTGANTYFDGAASGGSPPYTYEWDFGDGTAAQFEEDPAHVFAATGAYTVRLTVRDASGCSDSATTSVTVVAGPDVAVQTLAWSDACMAGGGTQAGCNINGDGNAQDNNIDTQEAGALTVTLINTGGTPLTGVTGVLSTSDGDVSLIEANAAFGNLAAGGGTGNGTFRFSVALNHFCRGYLPFSLAIEDSTKSYLKTLDVRPSMGAGTQATQSPTGGGATSNVDLATVIDTITVAEPGAGAPRIDRTYSVNVDVQIDTTGHGVADLQGFLIHDGISVTLWENNDFTGTQITGNFDATLTPVAPFTMDDFSNSTDAVGNWDLMVVDTVETGGTAVSTTITSWTLNLTSLENNDVETASASTAACFDDTTPPVFEGMKEAVDAHACSGDRIDVSWLPASDQSTPIKYHLYRRNQTTGGLYGPSIAEITGASFYQDTVPTGDTYCYLVVAEDAQGNFNPNPGDAKIPLQPTGTDGSGFPFTEVCGAASGDSLAPTWDNAAKVGLLSVTQVTCDTLRLTLGTASDNCTAAPAINYRVFVRDITDSVPNTTNLDGAADFTFTTADDLNLDGDAQTLEVDVSTETQGGVMLQAGHQYCYVVRAEDALTNRTTNSNQVCGNTGCPGEVSSLAEGETPLTLAKAAPLDLDLGWNVETGANGYSAYRGTIPSFYDHVPVLQQCVAALAWTNDGALSDGSSYYYLVSGSNGLGEGILGMNTQTMALRPQEPTALICP